MDSTVASDGAVTPVSVDATSKIVRGKALSYQSDHTFSVSDVTHRGQRYSVKEDHKLQSSSKTSVDKNDKNVKVVKKIERNEISTPRTGLPGAPPADGIVISKGEGASQREKLIVCRTSEERQRNPERLNLDRRNLNVCPQLDGEEKLRLLNYQNNKIELISNLENLPQLIFLDFYNNDLQSLDGPLPSVTGLRVLMAGKNRISQISNLTQLRKLDVLDLHSNEIMEIKGLESQTELRVLNLAGNQISQMHSLSCLRSLTELNIRRNCIDTVSALDCLPALQRVFLSHNFIASFSNIRCLLLAQHLIELSLDGNPLSESDPEGYRRRIIESMPQLKHLDLQPISHEERAPSLPIALGVNLCNTASNLLEVNRKEEENIRNDYQDKILNKGKPAPSSLNPGAIDLPSNSRIVTLNGWGATDRSTNSAENPLWQSTYSRPEASNGIAVHALTPASPPTYSSALESYSAGVNHSEITTCPSTDSIVRQRGSTEQNNGSDTRVGSDSYNRSSSVISSLLSVRNATGQQSNIDHPLNQTRSSTSTKTRGVGESTIGSKAVISECPDGAQGDKMRARAIFVEGEEWEWPYSLTDSTSLAGLRGVSVMSINHMSATGIKSIISENLVYLPSLSVLKLSDNNITTLTQICSVLSDFIGLERLSILNNPISILGGSLRLYVVKMLPNLKYFNDVPISDEERIMATSSIRSLHQPTDHVTGDESGYEYGPRDGSRSAVVSLERDGACVHPHTVELREKNLQRHADEFKVEGAESNELHVEMDSSASGEYSIFTAGSAPNDIIERTESHLLFSKESGLDCISFRTHTALSSRLTLVPSAPQPLIFKDRGWSLNSEFEREEERIFHEVLDSILRETFLNTFNQSKA